MTGILQRGPRYFAVSAFCLGLSNVILIGADRLGLSSGAGVLLSAALLIPVGFLLQARLTFAVPLNWHAFFRYAAALMLNVPLSWLLLYGLHDVGGLDMLWAAPVSTGLLFLWTYMTSRWALARRSLQQTAF